MIGISVKLFSSEKLLFGSSVGFICDSSGFIFTYILTYTFDWCPIQDIFDLLSWECLICYWSRLELTLRADQRTFLNLIWVFFFTEGRIRHRYVVWKHAGDRGIDKVTKNSELGTYRNSIGITYKSLGLFFFFCGEQRQIAIVLLPFDLLSMWTGIFSWLLTQDLNFMKWRAPQPRRLRTSPC